MTNDAEQASGSALDAAPGQEHGHWPSEVREHQHIREGGSAHGRPSSWGLVGTVIAAFLAGGAALITQTWWLFWVCAGVVVVAVPAGKAIGIMNDTVAWGSNPAAGDGQQGG